MMEKKNAFMKIWECRDLGPITEYLHMKIVRDRIEKKLIIDQIDYAKKVVECFGQQNAKPVTVADHFYNVLVQMNGVTV